GRTVRNPDLLLARQGGENLLGEGERVVRPLVESEPRQGGEIVKGDAVAGGKRVRTRDEDVRRGEEERVERKPGVSQQFVDNLPVEIVAVEDAELTAERANVFDDVPGTRLSQ